MHGTELYAAVPLTVVDEGPSHREAMWRFGTDRRAARRMPNHSPPPGCRRTMPAGWPKLPGFTGIIDAILAAGREAPRKRRHMAQRTFDRLRDERGFTGGCAVVRDHVPLGDP